MEKNKNDLWSDYEFVKTVINSCTEYRHTLTPLTRLIGNFNKKHNDVQLAYNLKELKTTKQNLIRQNARLSKSK